MRQPNFYSAVYAIIPDAEGKILFAQRQNTGFMDGKYQVPAGHIEGAETPKAAMVRELREEVAIEVAEEDLEIVHVSHRISSGGGRAYFDVYLAVSRFSGTPKIGEPDKCSDLRYFDLARIDPSHFIGYDVDVIRMVKEGKTFSHFHTL